MKIALWYLGVVLTAVALLFAVLASSWMLSSCALALALILKATNKYIPLPKIYTELGIKNEIFEGAVRDEKNH